jgi:hypothetical protein
MPAIQKRFIRADTEVDECQLQWLKQRAIAERCSFESLLNSIFDLGLFNYRKLNDQEDQAAGGSKTN